MHGQVEYSLLDAFALDRLQKLNFEFGLLEEVQVRVGRRNAENLVLFIVCDASYKTFLFQRQLPLFDASLVSRVVKFDHALVPFESHDSVD